MTAPSSSSTSGSISGLGAVTIVGQATAEQALAAHMQRGGGAGSVLIVGPDGVGRYLLALGSARAILGTSEAAAARVDSLQHVDLSVLDPAEGIDGVRAAVERLSRKPAEGARQVLILRDFDRMSDAAQNALLKTLEEPPAGAALIVLAESSDQLPETVVSRCRIVRARALSPEEMRSLGIPDDRIAVAEGSPGLAAADAERWDAAQKLAGWMGQRAADPVGDVDTIVRRRSGEKAADQRARLEQVLRLCAAHLRRSLPESEQRLRLCVRALGFMADNANPSILFSELVLHPWKTPKKTPSPH